MIYKGHYIIKLSGSRTSYTFHSVHDSYSEPNWYYSTIKQVKLAIIEANKVGKYPIPGYYESDTQLMKKNKKYLEAAKLISRKNFFDGVCFSLNMVGQYPHNFNYIFKPDDVTEDIFYFGNRWVPENKLARSLALLFMYEMGEE